MGWTYLLQHKGDTFATFVEWKALVERQSGRSLKVLRSDNGGEYVGRNFRDYLGKEGIQHQFTVPHNPEQNRVAERYNRTLLEMARSMMLGAGAGVD